MPSSVLRSLCSFISCNHPMRKVLLLLPLSLQMGKLRHRVELICPGSHRNDSDPGILLVPDTLGTSVFYLSLFQLETRIHRLCAVRLRAYHPVNYCSNVSMLLECLKYKHNVLEQNPSLSWVWFGFCLCSAVCVPRKSSLSPWWPFGCLYSDKWGRAQDKTIQNWKPLFPDLWQRRTPVPCHLFRRADLLFPRVRCSWSVLDKLLINLVMLLWLRGDLLWGGVFWLRQRHQCN